MTGEPRKLAAYEQKKVEEEESLNADITYEVVRREGEKELERSTSALAWSGIAGGLAMGLSFLGAGLLRASLPDAPWRHLVVNLSYPLGFLVITLASQQLFTENTVTAVVPLLIQRTREKLFNVARLWVVVLAANVVGALIFATVLALTEAVSPEVRRALADIGKEALEPAFTVMFLRGIFAGWLIALMVWMLPAASKEQIPVIIIMTYLVGIASFAHIIVGSIEVLYLVVRGDATIGAYVRDFFIPALAGNVVGGVALVSGLNFGQVAAGDSKSKSA